MGEITISLFSTLCAELRLILSGSLRYWGYTKQLDAMDCGPTCLRMVAKYYGRSISLEWLRNKSQYGKEGVSMLGLADAAKIFGLKKVGANLSFDAKLK